MEASDQVTELGSSGSSDGDMPPGWIEQTDPTSHHKYYVNTLDGKSTWVRPVAHKVKSSPTGRGPSRAGVSRADVRKSILQQTPLMLVKDSDDDEKDDDDEGSGLRESSPRQKKSLMQRVSSHTPDGTILEVTSSAPAPKNFNQETLLEYSIGSFAEQHFEYIVKHKGFSLFTKKLTNADLLSFDKKLTQPLLKSTIEDGYTPVAVQFFKNITGAMKDRSSSKNVEGHIERLSINGLANPTLRDELYCQIIRQTNRHLSDENLVLGWQLMAILLGIFPPSKLLLKAFRCFLQRQEEMMDRRFKGLQEYYKGGSLPADEDPLLAAVASLITPQSDEKESLLSRLEIITHLVTYCRKTLEQVIHNGERRHPAFSAEINGLQHLSADGRKGLRLEVKVNGTPYPVKCEPQTCAGDVVKTILEHTKLQVPSHQGVPCFGLIEEATLNGELVLENPISWRKSLFDVVQSWTEREREHPELSHELVFKPRLYFYYLLKEGVLRKDWGLQEYYEQSSQEFLRGNVSCKKEEDAISLAALSLQIKHGKAAKAEINAELPKILSSGMFEMVKQSDAKVDDSIAAAQEKYDGWSVDQCKQHYIEVLLRQPLYGSAIFDVSLVCDAKVGDWDFEDHRTKSRAKNTNKIAGKLEWRLAVSERGVLFMKENEDKIMKYDKFQEINSHGCDTTTFWYIIGNPAVPPTEDDAARVMVMETRQGRCIQEFFTAYQSLASNACKFQALQQFDMKNF